MGIALGEMGISLPDFLQLSPEQFEQAYKAHGEQALARERADWERMRLLATIVIQPHIRNKITPERLLPLPWDKQPKPVAIEGAATAKRRFEQLVTSLKNGNRNN